MSTCEQYQELLSDFLDGTLDASRSVTIKAHLEECSYCRSEHHALRSTVAMLRSAKAPDGRQAQRYALVNLRNAVMAKAPPRKQSFAGFRLAAATLAAATLAAITIQLGPRGPIDSSLMPVELASAVRSHSLPSAIELDEMVSLHAVHSFTVAAGDAGDQQVTLADATSRLH